jgi:hypothetical protein
MLGKSSVVANKQANYDSQFFQYVHFKQLSTGVRITAIFLSPKVLFINLSECKISVVFNK